MKLKTIYGFTKLEQAIEKAKELYKLGYSVQLKHSQTRYKYKFEVIKLNYTTF
jgi:hypothetical protein